MPHTADIGLLRPLRAAECEGVAALVNEVYLATEGPMWRAGAQRTSPTEIRSLAAAGQLHGVLHPDGALGVVRVEVSGSRAELGMLAVRPGARAGGWGSALVSYAEQHARDAGATTMELVVVRPREFSLPAKNQLGAWYPRLGYTRTGTTDLAETYPALLDEFVVPTLVDRYERTL